MKLNHRAQGTVSSWQQKCFKFYAYWNSTPRSPGKDNFPLPSTRGRGRACLCNGNAGDLQRKASQSALDLDDDLQEMKPKFPTEDELAETASVMRVLATAPAAISIAEGAPLLAWPQGRKAGGVDHPRARPSRPHHVGRRRVYVRAAPRGLTHDEILERLFKLNQERAGKG